MENTSSILDVLRSFTRTFHTPFGKDLTVTGKELLSMAAVLLVCIVLVVLICVLRRARKKRSADSERTFVPEMQVYASDDEETTDMPLQSNDTESAAEMPDLLEDPGCTIWEPSVPQVEAELRQEADESACVDLPPVPVPELELPTIVLIGSGGVFDRKRITQRGDVVIGRHPQRCTLVYPENAQGISAVHCRVQNSDGHILLTDLGSRCGTFVNGEKLKPNLPFRLQAGDTFWLADKTNSFFIP